MANVQLGKGDGEEQARTLSWDEGTSSEGESLPQSVAQAVERLRARHVFKAEMDTEALRFMFPQNERLQN